jgi:arylsulfatase A-like enzyme
VTFLDRRQFLASVTAATGFARAASPRQRQNPNVVLIYADDVGYGDLGCYGATGVKTPNLDRLARHGLRFTDAHSSAATCTPSRYSLLTGEYSFRLSKARVLPGDAPLLLEPGCTTLASLFQSKGYRTSAIGKWHLGLGDGTIDWNKEIKPGPLELGFDECFLIPATGDRVPCVYVENHRVAGLDPADPIEVNYSQPFEGEPTGKANPDSLRLKPSHGHDMTIVNGVSRIGYMKGGKAARWVDEDMADVLTQRATSFIEKNKQNPFFLYFATHDIHVPRVPNSRFESPMGARGAAIAELDWCVGQILDTVEKHGLARDTIVLFSSDNGPVVDDGYQDEAVEKLGAHKPAGGFRGGKYSNFEAGTRVPLLIRWPGRIKHGTSRALVSQVDFLKSFAKLLKTDLPMGTGRDSADLLPALLGDTRVGRSHLVEQAGVLSLRAGLWKFIEPGNGPKHNPQTNTELGNDPQPQLYDLSNDPGEKRNMAPAMPGKIEQMKTLLDRIRAGEFVP